ncbi:MAG: CAP domain-containing protein [Thaumarchaeota archaeon]|nr:CAP domain-containing protein [Nitrososphaerota archaeon]
MRAANSRVTATVLVALAVTATLTIVYVVPYDTILTSPPSHGDSAATSASSSTTSTTVTTHTGNNASASFLFSPLLAPGAKLAMTYPSEYDQLASFVLGRINRDRAASNLSPVQLSSIPSGQQHADSMLHFGYLSHWDTQGLKPYVRYSLLNGTGAMEENVAYESTDLPTFTNLGFIESSLARLENQMMNNDSLCCDNGHRDNILDPIHNFVSLGIEYNGTRVYLVEDFENSYTSLAQPMATGGTVSFVGNSSINLRNLQVVVYYDQLPANLTAAQMRSPPYSGSYSSGEFIGGVVPSCFLSCEKYQSGTTVRADTWDTTNSTVRIDFKLADFVSSYGKGVYTVYLETGPDDDVTGTPETLVGVSILSG